MGYLRIKLGCQLRDLSKNLRLELQKFKSKLMTYQLIKTILHNCDNEYSDMEDLEDNKKCEASASQSILAWKEKF